MYQQQETLIFPRWNWIEELCACLLNISIFCLCLKCLSILRLKIDLHFKMIFLKTQEKMIVYICQKISFFNNDWKLKLKNVQTFHFLMKPFSFEFKETPLKCWHRIGDSYIFCMTMFKIKNVRYWEISILQDKSKVDIKKCKMVTINKRQKSFIWIWRKERCLWDVKSPSYKKRNEKNKSYGKFKLELGLEVLLVCFVFFLVCKTVLFKLHKMVKPPQTVRRLLPSNCFSMFDHFVGLALKGLSKHL